MTSKNINKCGAIYMSAIAAFFRIGYNMYNNKLGTIQVLHQQVFFNSDFGFQVLDFRFQTVFKCLISDLLFQIEVQGC